MKYKFLLLLAFSSVISKPDLAFSQKKGEPNVNIWSNDSIKVDGKINDWNDSLLLYNDATKFYYSISNDDKNIYVAIKSINSADNSRILAGGISVLINTEGKKKSGPQVTFPIVEKQGGRNIKARRQEDNAAPPDIKEIRKQTLSRIKEIKVQGFKSIIDGGISLYNTYGIQAAVTFDDKDQLIYELAVPLRLLDLFIENPVLLAYNIKINGLVHPPMPGGQQTDRMSGMQNRSGNGAFGGYSDRQNSMETSKLFLSTDFWIKSHLAKKE